MKKGFSLVELLVSIIVIACITAAFVPLITKKFSSNVFGIGGDGGYTTDCKDKFGPNCVFCSSNRCIDCNLSCSDGQYKDTNSCTCKDCKDKYGEDCEKCNEKKCLTCPDGEYLDSDENCKSCSDKFTNCATCTESECTSCADGYVLTDPTSNTPCSSFSCSSPDFIQIGNLCITKKNMGDGTSLTIPNGVTVANVDQTCNSSSSNKCCWKGATSGTNCDNANGGAYSGCNRTVCTWSAADYICKNFTAGARTWRLATKDEMSNWATNSKGLGVNGLQLCDYGSGYSSAYCNGSYSCSGSPNGWCYPYYVWSGTVNGSSYAYIYYLSSGSWNQARNFRTTAFSVRCVAEVTSCADKISAGCEMCDGNTCLKCASGYVLKNGKCEKEVFNCSGPDFIQIGKLCITKKNMGDSTALAIPSGVAVANVNQTCNSSSSNKCCWKGATSGTSCNNNGGEPYSGCDRTVCDWWAADYICKNFTAGGRTWRLPIPSEMSNWGSNSIGLEVNGLQLCDYRSGYSSARCTGSNSCPGSNNVWCTPSYVWSGTVNGSSYAYNYSLNSGSWGQTNGYRTYASSVRCVAEVTSCADKISAGCEMCDGNTCLKCASGYVLKNGKCEIDCSTKFGSTCTSCTASACTGCANGYHLSDSTCVADFTCSGSDFMQIGSLCVTRKNMGDSTALAIPSGVTVVNINQNCNVGTQKCCWRGATAGTDCDNNGGGAYSGCNRTVCDWYAADYICKNFTAGGRTWRLATSSEMSNWGTNSVGLGVNGLQLCDNYSGSSSAYCYGSSSCPGSYNDWCYPYSVRSGTVFDFDSSAAYHYGLYSGSWSQNISPRTVAFSVRCVAEVTSCADKISAGCEMCDGNTCLKCADGYNLKNGKCEIDCASKFGSSCTACTTSA